MSFDRYEAAMELIRRRVALAAGMMPGHLTGPSHRATIVRARHLAMWLARRLTGASLPQIGRAFGGRDHTTVMHAIRATEARFDREPEFRARAERLATELRAALGIDADSRRAIDEVALKVRNRLTELAAAEPRVLLRALAALDDALPRRPRHGGRASLLGPAPASAQMVCAGRDQARAYVEGVRNQRPVTEALNHQGQIVETFVGRDRSWTVVITDARGLACLAMEGGDYEGPRPAPPERAENNQ